MNQSSLAQGQHHSQWPFSLGMENEKAKNKLKLVLSVEAAVLNFGSVSLLTNSQDGKEKA